MNGSNPYCIVPMYGDKTTASGGNAQIYTSASNTNWTTAKGLGSPPGNNAIFCTLGNTNDPANTNLHDFWDFFPFTTTATSRAWPSC